MITDNFKCEDCQIIFIVSKMTTEENFPEENKCPGCESINTYRVWQMPMSDIGEGKLGNASTKYQTGHTYHPSKYGSFKGKTIRSIK
jgi:hypothetical protein